MARTFLKKRLVTCFVCLCVVYALVGCGNHVQQNGESSMIKVINDSTEKLYGIGYAYYVDGQIMSSGGACNADNSAIKIGDVFPLENHSSLENAKNVELELSVVDKEGVEYPCATKVSLEEMSCEIKVTGDFENGFDASVETN